MDINELKKLAQAVIKKPVLSEANLDASLDYFRAIREYENAANPAAVLELIEQVERMRGLLRRVEWEGYDTAYEERECPICTGLRSIGHDYDCQLVHALEGGAA